ncbi:MAG: hypothetical protein CVU39_08040 [Chloroflexi bacterium HGW-Chloroflexi-10]|nr:MAG: hypothetical protein CVU39_08040 [Chloroflexi bacterium HGW-Chloroflexi-10]
MIQAQFPYGVSYSPLIFAENEWAAELQRMQDAGINLVRIGDVHGSWDRIEPVEGQLKIDVLQRFYIIAQDYGIQVLLSTGAASPPLWLASRHPEVSILSSRGERYPLGASYHWACVNNPDYRSAAESYLKRIAEFVVQFPTHFGWQISNEIGYPFMPARESTELGLYCYCEYCQKSFREWLKEKYQSLEALTFAWSWSTTNFVYSSWEEIRAPESLPASWSGVTRWIDWRLFCQDSFVRFSGWQHGIIRQVDSSHPTSINTFNFKGLDRFGTFMGLDQWKIASQVDHIGYDLYPGTGNKLSSRPEHNSIFLDHGRSVAKSQGRAFWLHEVESGPIGGWVLGPEHDTNEQDVANNVIESLGHDAKLILFMPWREWDYQPLHWGALVDLDGQPTRRYDVARELGHFIQENTEFFLKANVVSSMAAIYESKSNAIFFRGVNQEETLFSAQRGVYRDLWEANFGVDFISKDQLNSAYLQPYNILCLPLVGLMNETESHALAEYVFQGGILIAFARVATLNEGGWYYHKLPGAGLDQVFGLDSVTASTLDKHTILMGDKVFAGHLNRDILKPASTTKVLAKFDDGLPAITVANYGKGLAVYIATQVDGGGQDHKPGLLAAVLENLGIDQKLLPRIHLECSVGRAGGIDTHVLQGQGKTVVMFSNYYQKDLEAALHLPSNNHQPLIVRQVYPEKTALDWVTQAESLQIALNFKAKEVKVIEVCWL